ncbi:MAG: ComEA family DNA-binding protein [bacterium]
MQSFSQLQIKTLALLLGVLIIGVGVKYWQHSRPLPEVNPELKKRFVAISDSLNFAESSQENLKAAKVTSIQNAKININTATIAELQLLPGIGPVLGERMIKFRNERGSFRRIEDLLKVKGIGRNTLEKLSELITLD